MLFLLLCGILFPHSHGYNIPNIPSVHGTHYETSYPASDHGHTYETVGTHYETRQPEISYHTFGTNQPGQISQILQQYPWLTQWQQKWGLTSNDGTFGLSQSSQDTFGDSHTVNGQENPTQEKAYENPFMQVSNPGEDIDDNSQAAETISKPSLDQTDEDSEPPPFPDDTNDDDDAYAGESSGDEPPKYFYEPPKYIDTNAFSDNNSDTKSVITPEGKKNTTTPIPPPMSSTPPSGPEPGTMSRPVPKLGLLFAPSLQWHVGIYSKTFTPYMQVCGGSLVKADVVLSAAHCFWNEDVGALRPGLFAVAGGKLLRPWETEGEIYTQHSDIKDIKIPPRFRGSKTSFQDDIAIVLLTSSLEYAPGVKPVCISFDLEVDRRHLTSGNLGKIAGWGLTEPNGLPSQRLNYLELPYVDIEECLRTADDSFLKYITSDKICAGDQKTGRALCRGDSGGGLIYFSSPIPYLHGIASTAPRDNNQCNAYAVASFTHVQAHRPFLIGHVPDIGEGCEELYVNRTEAVQNETIKPDDASLTQSGPSQAQEEDRISTNIALESGVSNVSDLQISLTAPSQNDKNEEANTGEPISLTVPNQTDKNEESNTDEEILNPAVSSQDADNEESNTGEPISLTSENDKNGVSNMGDQISNLTVSSQNANNEESNTEEPIFLTVPSQTDKNEGSNTGDIISNNKESNIGEPISLTVPHWNDKTRVSNTEVQISHSANQADRPIWETNENEQEVVMNVGSGERGVAKISVDNNTRTFVCNCYCNK